MTTIAAVIAILSASPYQNRSSGDMDDTGLNAPLPARREREKYYVRFKLTSTGGPLLIVW
jgi:hypothetical protein